jgi:hypothetical protein
MEVKFPTPCSDGVLKGCITLAVVRMRYSVNFGLKPLAFSISAATILLVNSSVSLHCAPANLPVLRPPRCMGKPYISTPSCFCPDRPCRTIYGSSQIRFSTSAHISSNSSQDFGLGSCVVVGEGIWLPRLLDSLRENSTGGCSSEGLSASQLVTRRIHFGHPPPVNGNTNLIRPFSESAANANPMRRRSNWYDKSALRDRPNLE